jgi:integrase
MAEREGFEPSVRIISPQFLKTLIFFDFSDTGNTVDWNVCWHYCWRMASIHRKKRSSFWHCSFTLPDGKRTRRSTGTSDKRKAQKVCSEFELAARLGKEGRLTEARAREAIAAIYSVANVDSLPSSTVRDYLKGWLGRKKLEVSPSSYAAYNQATVELLKFLGDKGEKPVDSIPLKVLTAFRDDLASRVSGSTVNKITKILRGAWARALKDGLIRENLFARVDLVKARGAKRRAFTLPELKKILDACDVEWRGMVLVSLYTGQRLGDIATLTWREVDLADNEIRFMTDKTDRAMVIPIATPLAKWLLGLSAPDQLDEPVFPRSFKIGSKRVGTLSNQFGVILANAGLIKKKSHDKQEEGEGRTARRETGGLSFHCLRHTATSLLKNAGVSDVIAREIIGHDSEAVSRAYTHIETDSLRHALNKLPDVTKAN